MVGGFWAFGLAFMLLHVAENGDLIINVLERCPPTEVGGLSLEFRV